MALGTLGIGEQINGVNLGNWLVLEKWMKPGIFCRQRRSGRDLAASGYGVC